MRHPAVVEKNYGMSCGVSCLVHIYQCAHCGQWHIGHYTPEAEKGNLSHVSNTSAYIRPLNDDAGLSRRTIKE